jgi:integration host factor subunit alpha
MTATKKKIIDALFKQGGLSKTTAREAVEKLLQILKETLAGDEDVLVSGFGKFQVKRKRARYGRNPRTGEVLEIRQPPEVSFHISEILLRKISGEEVDTNADEVFHSENHILAKIGQKADRKQIKPRYVWVKTG